MGASNTKNIKKDSNLKPKIAVKKFLTVGFYGAGKTSFTYRLKHGEVPEGYMTTMGVDFQILYHGDLKLQAWDQRGRERTRSIAGSYYRGSSGIIFMIDSADASHFDESMTHLNTIFDNEDLTNMTLMVVANKQDLDDAVGPDVIEDMIKEKCRIGPGFSVFVMPMSVTAEDDHSVQLAFRLFVKMMMRNDKGKETVPRGLIPRAWETAEKDAEDSDVELDEVGDHDDKTKPAENDVVLKDKTKEEIVGYPALILNEKKKSFFQDPVHMFKSLLIR